MISIIVPCYNQAQYLDECLQSVLNQTFQNWECIIVNDGSPDNTEEIAKKWAEKDPRFRYYNKENGGVASARNFGIVHSKGDWILPLDGDDKLGIDFLAKTFAKTKENYDVVYSQTQYFGEKNELFVLPEYSYLEILKRNIIPCTALYRKDKLHNVLYDEQLIHGLEDWEFWISYLSTSEIKVFRIPEVLFYYRIKEFSRNQQAKESLAKTQEAEAYIFQKHQALYLKEFGNYFTLLKKKSSLEKDNKHFQKLLNSRRVIFVNTLHTFLNKFRK